MLSSREIAKQSLEQCEAFVPRTEGERRVWQSNLDQLRGYLAGLAPRPDHPTAVRT